MRAVHSCNSWLTNQEQSMSLTNQFKTKHAYGLGFQHLPRDLANVNAWKTMFDPYIDSTSLCIGYVASKLFKPCVSDR